MQKLMMKLRSGGSEGTLLRGAGSLILLNPLGLLISFLVMSIILPRVMTVESYGIYNVAMAWLQVFILVALVGQDTSLVRFIPQYIVKKQWGELRGVLLHATSLSQAVSAGLIALLAAVIYYLAPQLGTEKTITYFFALPLIAVIALTTLREASLRAFKHVALSYIPDSIVRPLILGLSALILFWFSGQLVSASQLMLLSFISILSAFALGGYWLYRALPVVVYQAKAVYHTTTWIKVSLPLFFISGMNLILRRTDIVMLDLFQGETLAGLYSVASRLADLASFGLVAVNTITAPMISELYNKGEHKELQNIITLAARGIFVITVLVSLVMIVAGTFLLGLSGQDYTVAYIPLLILLAGQAVNALSGSVGFIMTMTGHQNQAAVIIASGALLNILLNIILIPAYGMNGAAIATAVTTALWNIAMLIYVLVKLKLNPTVIG